MSNNENQDVMVEDSEIEQIPLSNTGSEVCLKEKKKN